MTEATGATTSLREPPSGSVAHGMTFYKITKFYVVVEELK